MTLRILSGGAANGLVSALSDRVLADTGHHVKGDFGAVGVMRDRFLGGEAVDALILTRAIIDDLVASGHVDPNSVRDIGKVATGIAVLEGRSAPRPGHAGRPPDDAHGRRHALRSRYDEIDGGRACREHAVRSRPRRDDGAKTSESFQTVRPRWPRWSKRTKRVLWDAHRSPRSSIRLVSNTPEICLSLSG